MNYTSFENDFFSVKNAKAFADYASKRSKNKNYAKVLSDQQRIKLLADENELSEEERAILNYYSRSGLDYDIDEFIANVKEGSVVEMFKKEKELTEEEYEDWLDYALDR